MHRVSIVYFSQAGTTALLAEAIGRGARADANVDVALLRIRPESIHEGRWQDDDTLHALADSDTIVFGAPTYMGGGAAQFKAFADATAQPSEQHGLPAASTKPARSQCWKCSMPSAVCSISSEAKPWLLPS